MSSAFDCLFAMLQACWASAGNMLKVMYFMPACLLLPHRQSTPLQWTRTSMFHNGKYQMHADFLYLLLLHELTV